MENTAAVRGKECSYRTAEIFDLFMELDERMTRDIRVHYEGDVNVCTIE